MISDISRKKNTITEYRTLNLLSKLSLLLYDQAHRVYWRKQHSRAKKNIDAFDLENLDSYKSSVWQLYIRVYISTRYIVRWVFAHYARFSYPTFEWKLFGKATRFCTKTTTGLNGYWNFSTLSVYCKVEFLIDVFSNQINIPKHSVIQIKLFIVLNF